MERECTRERATHDLVRTRLIVVVDDAAEEVVRDPDHVLRTGPNLGPDVLDSSPPGRVRHELVPSVRFEQRTSSESNSGKFFPVRRFVGREPRVGAGLVRAPDQERRREVRGQEREQGALELKLGRSEVDRTERVVSAGVGGKLGGGARREGGGLAGRADDLRVQRVDGLGCGGRRRVRSIDVRGLLQQRLLCDTVRKSSVRRGEVGRPAASA